ncbi:MAG: serine protease [Alphaproteobacteria bacterium]|nr:MAG: serine protease [Alphaproteobacteria bacterium]
MRSAIIPGLPFAFLFTICMYCSPAAQAGRVQQQAATDEAQRIFQSYGDAIYQVQTIDLASDKKSSIGSGFQFTQDGMIATNYHVVAEAVQRPKSNRLEFLHGKSERGNLRILIADVVHDLAILKMEAPGKTWVELGQSLLPKGVRLFSLGNPHDIGFTIIEGTYNGKSEESFIDKIHFSGSLNPGMSGGPALGHDGKVVGVNVSTAGNQISFLVPVDHLRNLMLEYLRQDAKFDFLAQASAHIERQLLASQKQNIDRMLAAQWPSQAFGPFMVPGRITEAFKCWGDSDVQEKNQYSGYHSTCTSQDRQFLDENSGSGESFYTGTYLYRYDNLVGEDELNLDRFYALYEDQYSMPLEAYRNGGESNVTNFDCNSSFVDVAGKRWKSSFCIRQYIKYPQLYDMHLYMALVGEGRQGMMATQVAEGVSKDSALKLARKFMSEIRPAAASKAPGKPAPAAPVAAEPAKESPAPQEDPGDETPASGRGGGLKR